MPAAECVVFDCGSHSMRVGMGGNDAPSQSIPVATYFTPSEEEQRDDKLLMATSLAAPLYDVRPCAQRLFTPTRVVGDWAMMRRLMGIIDLGGIGEGEGGGDGGDGGMCLILTESPMNTARARAEALEQLLEEGSSNNGDNTSRRSVCLANTAVLSLFAAGRTDGAVIDVGQRSTMLSAVMEGQLVGVEWTPLGGEDVSAVVAQVLGADVMASLTTPPPSADPSSYATPSPPPRPTSVLLGAYYSRIEDLKRQIFLTDGERHAELTLPDGAPLMLPSVCRPSSPQFSFAELQHSAASVLYSPSDVLSSIMAMASTSFTGGDTCTAPLLSTKMSATPIHMLPYRLCEQLSGYGGSEGVLARRGSGAPPLEDAVALAATTLPLFAHNVLLCGGASLSQGFGAGYEAAVRRAFGRATTAPSGAAPCPFLASYSVSVAPERRYHAWIGGSILSTLGGGSVVEQMSVSKALYDECGAEGAVRAMAGWSQSFAIQ